MMNSFWYGDFRPAVLAMQMAVSILSPVIIQMLMPAFRNCWMHSWMSSCSLSYTPVIPSSCILAYRDSTTLVTAASLLIMVELASSYSFFQSLYSCSDNIFSARTKVRRPYLENSSQLSSTKALNISGT